MVIFWEINLNQGAIKDLHANLVLRPIVYLLFSAVLDSLLVAFEKKPLQCHPNTCSIMRLLGNYSL